MRKHKVLLWLVLSALGFSACAVPAEPPQTTPPETTYTVPAESFQTTPPETTAETPKPSAPNADTNFTMDFSRPGKIINNKLSDMNVWMFQRTWMEPSREFPADYFAKNMPFVRRMQFMQATGGNFERDLFREPENFQVRDDCDFHPLLFACESALRQGLQPMIKTGNIPLKYSALNTQGTFDVNLYPPDDYDEYYAYITAMTQALVLSFGKEQVKTWRFGVFTEYENADWFTTGSKQETFEEFCKIYDYTAAAIESVLGKGIDIGAHSMSVVEGFWPEEDFIRHCAVGVNYCTGEIGSPLTYLAVSFYDENPNNLFGSIRSLPDTVEKVRQAALSVGFTDLEYGVDEGRILSGKKGFNRADLLSRIVGQTYQAAYDARILLQMVEHDIDYFAMWSYTSGLVMGGLPSVALHTANEFYKLVGAFHVPVEAVHNTRAYRSESNALAALSEDGVGHIMAYNFGRWLEYDEEKVFSFAISGLQKDGKPAQKAKLTVTLIDDDANFFDEWMADCEEAGITAEDFSWSPDSAQIEGNLRTGEARTIYAENQERYLAAAELSPKATEIDLENGEVLLTITLSPHSVVFYTIEPLE